MFYFTPPIWRNIFQYDPTYHQLFDKVLSELKSATWLWTIRTAIKDKNNPYLYNYYIKSKLGKHEYCKSYKNTKTLSYYWNYQYRPEITNPGAWIHPEFIKDKHDNCNYLIFNHIKTLKKVHKKMIQDTGNSERYYESLLKS